MLVQVQDRPKIPSIVTFVLGAQKNPLIEKKQWFPQLGQYVCLQKTQLNYF